MPSFEIIIPGPLSTVQDLGRRGYLSAGFCPSGVMDVNAARIANTLAGNFEREGQICAAVIEMTMQGVTGRFIGDALFAVTGADMPILLNDSPIEPYKARMARSGDTLSIGYARSGCRAYLAFSGGVDVPVVMGSRSTHIKCGIGGYEGRKLARADVLRIGTPHSLPKTAAMASPILYRTGAIHVCEGPQFARFAKKETDAFLSSEYTVSPQSDRMGIRLDGPLVACEGGADIVSDGIPNGAIQISNLGQPMILLADRQTIGGYAKPFVVIEADLPRLGQMRPGDKVRFRKVSQRQARMAYLETMIELGVTQRKIEEAYTGSYRFMGFTIGRG